jgi:hypothetical protein
MLPAKPRFHRQTHYARTLARTPPRGSAPRLTSALSCLQNLAALGLLHLSLALSVAPYSPFNFPANKSVALPFGLDQV